MAIEVFDSWVRIDQHEKIEGPDWKFQGEN